MKDLLGIGLRVRAIVTDNHSANVAAFKVLLSSMPGDKKHYFVHPEAPCKTYVFFDSVHLLKNIRNNLLNARKFVFPAMDFEVCGTQIVSEPGFVSWGDLHKIHDVDKNLDAHLRKAPKLTYKALHPGNNKQCVGLALGVFHESTIAACKGLYPNRNDMFSFLKLVNIWWTCSNSCSRYTSNPLANATTPDDGKVEFFLKLSDWLESWAAECTNFGLSKQTFNALILTLRSQSMLITDLFADGYQYVRYRQLQSDPIERRFSQYRAMSGGRFLVSLREVQSSEKILKSRSLLKIGYDYWVEDRDETHEESLLQDTNDFLAILEDKENEIVEASLSADSEEVAHYIAGNIAKRIIERVKCCDCESHVIETGDHVDTPHNTYLSDLSRGGLTIPSREVSDFVCNGYALLDLLDEHMGINVRHMSLVALDKYSPDLAIGCETHKVSNRKFALKVITNTFFNNKQNQATDTVREDGVKSFKQRQRRKESGLV
jgi:hypothetical protein